MHNTYHRFATIPSFYYRLGIMIVNAMKERGVANAKVIALGYPATYGGYPLSIEAFRNSIDSSIDIVKETPLARPDSRQSAYMEIVNLIDNNVEFNGVYAMDDDILLGAYDALNDQGRVYVKGKNDGTDAVTLVGTVCNGARELLENGEQYGTTIQAPFWRRRWHLSRLLSTWRLGSSIRRFASHQILLPLEVSTCADSHIMIHLPLLIPTIVSLTVLTFYVIHLFILK